MRTATVSTKKCTICYRNTERLPLEDVPSNAAICIFYGDFVPDFVFYCRECEIFGL